MILKLLLVIAVIAVVYFMFIKKKPIQNKAEPKKNKKKEKIEASDMIECPTCGIYSELGDSVLSNGKYYCSSECASKAL